MTGPIVAFEVRPDEMGDVERCAASRNCEIITTTLPLSADTLGDTPKTDTVSVLGRSKINDELMQKLAEYGIRFVSTRTVGFDHIDVKAARKYGIKVAHVTYPPNSVAEYTIMLILMTMRRMKSIMRRTEVQDFSLVGSQGKELGNSTVGIIGTGRIGSAVARLLKPFGTRIIATDPFPNESLGDIVEYVDLETLMSGSDLITLHAPAAPENHHMLNAELIGKMRPGSAIVNCGRGDLIDPKALISAVESGHIAEVALDVLENDLEYFHRDARFETIRNSDLMLLRSFPNVLVTPHIAFYTKEVVSAMVEQSIDSLLELRNTGSSDLVVS